MVSLLYLATIHEKSKTTTKSSASLHLYTIDLHHDQNVRRSR